MSKITYIAVLLMMLILASCNKSDSVSPGGSTTQTGSLASFNTIDHYLLLADGSQLHTYDISDPKHPIHTDTYQDDDNIIETIFVLNGQIFLGTREAMIVMNISSDGKLSEAGVASHMRSCDPVVVEKNIAYVTTRAAGRCGGLDQLIVYDVADIYYPSQITSVPMDDPLGLAINTDILYVCERQQGIAVFNVSDPSNPVHIKTVAAELPKDIIVMSTEEMLVLNENYISFYDITEPMNPVFKYKYE